MSKVRNAAEYSIPCPRCGKMHIFQAEYVDSMIDCDCGFEGYAFAVGDFRIIMSRAEALNESVVRSMRRFVILTGRCTDIPPELYMDEGELQECAIKPPVVHDIEEELERTLEEYQVAAFGEYLLTSELLDFICECLSEEKDIELRRKKDGVEISELKKHKFKIPPKKPYRDLLGERCGTLNIHNRTTVFTHKSVNILRNSSGILKPNPVMTADNSLKN